MKGVAQQHLRADRAQHIRCHALDGTVCATGLKNRCLHRAMGQRELAPACTAFLSDYFKHRDTPSIELTKHTSPFSCKRNAPHGVG